MKQLSKALLALTALFAPTYVSAAIINFDALPSGAISGFSLQGFEFTVINNGGTASGGITNDGDGNPGKAFEGYYQDNDSVLLSVVTSSGNDFTVQGFDFWHDDTSSELAVSWISSGGVVDETHIGGLVGTWHESLTTIPTTLIRQLNFDFAQGLGGGIGGIPTGDEFTARIDNLELTEIAEVPVPGTLLLCLTALGFLRQRSGNGVLRRPLI